MKLQATVLVSCLAWVPAYAAAAAQPNPPDVHVIVARMAQARADNQTRMRAYTVTRSYQLFDGDKVNPKSLITADVTFALPDRKTFVIQTATGSNWGEKVVHRILETEVSTAQETSADFSEKNYDFRLISEEQRGGAHCLVLGVSPKREDKNLLRGNIWVDADTYLVHRAEGDLAKNPSWWVKNVHVVLLFSDAEGMWMQTEFEAIADVRLLGENTLTSHDMKLTVRDKDSEVTEAEAKQKQGSGF